MVAYSFQKQFIEPILAGTKTQTIRPVGKRRHARPGDAIQLYTAMRTKHCRKIRDDVGCASTHECILRFEHGELVDVHVDGQSVEDLDDFARRDGFHDVSDMTEFWARNHGTCGRSVESYPLKLIKWTP